jgi:hypothetical protein
VGTKRKYTLVHALTDFHRYRNVLKYFFVVYEVPVWHYFTDIYTKYGEYWGAGGYTVEQLVEALCYKPEGDEFSFLMTTKDFSIYLFLIPSSCTMALSIGDLPRGKARPARKTDNLAPSVSLLSWISKCHRPSLKNDFRKSSPTWKSSGSVAVVRRYGPCASDVPLSLCIACFVVTASARSSICKYRKKGVTW